MLYFLITSPLSSGQQFYFDTFTSHSAGSQWGDKGRYVIEKIYKLSLNLLEVKGKVNRVKNAFSNWILVQVFIKQRSKPVVIVSVKCFQFDRYVWKMFFPGWPESLKRNSVIQGPERNYGGFVLFFGWFWCVWGGFFWNFKQSRYCHNNPD